jgi:iron complex outermembrane recepter protein
MTNRFHTKVLLLATTSILVPIVALAQNTAPTPEDRAVEEVVVIGVRLQNRLSIDQKRIADVTADFLAADEINRQPDFNIADAFRRAPGVFTIFDEDEGRYVGIRGLNPSFTVATIDGAGIASSERGNRQINLEAVPSSAVKRLSIIKSRTAAEEGNAIGGTIRLTTRSAFDKRGFFAAGSASIGMTDSQDVPGEGLGRSSDNGPSYRVEGTISTLFANDTIGVLFSGAYLQRRRDQQRYIPTSYAAALPGNFPQPNGFLYGGYPNTINRFGGLGKIEYKPNDSLYLSLLASHFTQEDNELRQFQQLNRQGTISQPNPNTAAFTAGNAFVRFNDFFIDKPLTTFQGKGEWHVNDNHSFNALISYSKATFHEPSNEIQFNTTANNTNLGGSYTAEGGAPRLTLANPSFYLNAANYSFASYDFYDQDNDDIVEEAEVNYGFNTQPGDLGLGVDAGVQVRSTLRIFDEQRLRVRPGSVNTLTLTSFVAANSQNYTAPYANQNMIFLDAQAFLNFYSANKANFVVTESNIAADYRFEEEVAAAYAQLVLRGERYKVIAGARYERTTTDVTRPRGGVSVTRSNEYDNFLPSITAFYDISDRIKLRGAFYQALGRPNPIDLAGAETVTTGGDGVPQLTRGNPELEARLSNNFDASLEYYTPGNQSVASVGVFIKEISNDIFNFTDLEVIDGVTTRVTQARNVAGARVQGVELNFIQNRLTFLPGGLKDIGISTNFTVIDGKVEVTGPGRSLLRTSRLLQQPKTIFNTSLFYSHGPIEARLTYARSSEFLTSLATSASSDQDREDRPYEQWDLSARFNVSERLQLTAEARNIMNETRSNYQKALTGDVLRDYNIYGRTFFVGAAIKL